MKLAIEQQTKQIAKRIKDLRYTAGLSVEQMATVAGVEIEEYINYEGGRLDFQLSFLLKVAHIFGLDITQLVTGETLNLAPYALVRRGQGLPIQRREGLHYQHLAYLMQSRRFEPFVVRAEYSQQEQTIPVPTTAHKGQEMDYVLKGSLKVRLDDENIVLEEGDCLLYDSAQPHGMIATGGCDCEFLAIVIADTSQGEYATPKIAAPIMEDKPIVRQPAVKWSWKSR